MTHKEDIEAFKRSLPSSETSTGNLFTVEEEELDQFLTSYGNKCREEERENTKRLYSVLLNHINNNPDCPLTLEGLQTLTT